MVWGAGGGFPSISFAANVLVPPLAYPFVWPMLLFGSEHMPVHLSIDYEESDFKYGTLSLTGCVINLIGLQVPDNGNTWSSTARGAGVKRYDISEKQYRGT